MPESIPDSVPLLDTARLGELLGALACRFDVEALAECDSTNSRLLARGNAPAGSVVVADRQQAGRGRRGRSWISDPARSLTFSLLWRFARPGAALAGLSLAVGVALARALGGRGDIALKWPNDLLRRQGQGWGKVGGVLVELSGDRASSTAVIGIGLNLLPPESPVSAALPAAGLADSVAPDRHEVLAAVLRELLPVLEAFARDGFAPLADEWQRHHAFAGCPVRIEEGGRVLGAGRCLGADTDGALLIASDGRPVRWVSGDVSLRPA